MILTLDIGTSSIRSALWTEDLHQHASFQRRYQIEYSQNGSATIDPDRLLEMVFQAIDNVVAKTDSCKAVAVSTFWHSLIALKNYRPVSPLINWDDTRSRSEADLLRLQLDEEEIHSRTGCRFHASYWPAKILYLKHSGLAADQYISLSDYIALKVFGVLQTSHSIASATGLYDHNSRYWDSQLTAHLDLAKLPEIVDEPYTAPLEEYARRWPSLKRAYWYPTTGDGAASNIGCGCTTAEKVALMIGTSGAMRAIGSPSVRMSALWRYRVDRDRAIVGGAVSNGGNLYQWLVRTLQDGQEIEQMASTLAPDSHGLTVLPHLSGERSPNWNDEATGVISGLRLSTTPVDIFRASLEALAFQFAEIFSQLQLALGNPALIVATGGGLLKSPLLQQIFSDVLGRELLVSDVAEASSRGAAILALERLGVLPDIEPKGRLVKPLEEAHKTYQAAIERYKRLYQKIHS